MTTKDIGAAGEQLVAEELAARGYAIVERNVRIGYVEVDILAMHGNRIVIIEVKTRGTDHLDERFGIDRAKLSRLCRAAGNYVRLKNLPHEVQIDLALVTNHPDGTSTMEYLDDVALPPMRRKFR